MSKAFDRYQQAIQDFTERVRAISLQINGNRAAHQEAVKKLEDAVLAGLDSKDAEQEIGKLNAEHEILTYKSQALNRATHRGTNSFVKTAAQAVITENQMALTKLRDEYNELMRQAGKVFNDYLKIMAACGKLYHQGQSLREEAHLAMTDAGTNIGISGVGDENNLAQLRGPIFPDPKTVREAFLTGTLPSGSAPEVPPQQEQAEVEEVVN